MSLPSRALTAVWACTLGLAAPARAADLDAPLGTGTEGVVRTLFLDVTGADARPASRPSAALRWQVANSWSSPTTLVRGADRADVQLDAQSDALTVALSAPWRALGHRVTSSIEARVTAWWGGWSDQPVEAWHRTLGFTNFERQDYSNNRVRLRITDARGHGAFDATRARWSFGHVVARNQLLLAEGGASRRDAARSRWAVSLRADLKLPVGAVSRLAGSGGTDVGFGAMATAELARWLVLHANAFTSAWSDLGGGVALQPRRFHHGAELSAVFVTGRWAFMLEDRLLSPVLPSSWRPSGVASYGDLAASASFALTRPHNQVSVGVRRGPFTAWIAEDFTPGRSIGGGSWFYNSNSPDITAGIEVARAF